MTSHNAGERRVAEFAVDYMDSLSTVPLAEREPQLRQSLYSSLLQVRSPLCSILPVSYLDLGTASVCKKVTMMLFEQAQLHPLSLMLQS